MFDGGRVVGGVGGDGALLVACIRVRGPGEAPEGLSSERNRTGPTASRMLRGHYPELGCVRGLLENLQCSTSYICTVAAGYM